MWGRVGQVPGLGGSGVSVCIGGWGAQERTRADAALGSLLPGDRGKEVLGTRQRLQFGPLLCNLVHVA